MKEFNIGDVVKIKTDMHGDDVLFMVVDFADFTEPSKHGEKPVIDIDYELMQIYPIMKTSKYMTLSQNDLMLHARKDSRDYELLLKMLQKERERRNWFGVPDYIDVANRNIKAISKYMKEERAELVKVKVPVKRLDVVRYDLIDNVDECLDAINDLNKLYEQFGDESYLQLKELVKDRIIRLQR